MIELNSRVERIGGNGVGHRDIVIHEMMESEIQFLKDSRWQFSLLSLAIGFILGGFFVLLTGPYPHS